MCPGGIDDTWTDTSIVWRGVCMRYGENSAALVALISLMAETLYKLEIVQGSKFPFTYELEEYTYMYAIEMRRGCEYE